MQLDAISREMIAADQKIDSDKVSVQTRSDIMSSRLNDKCQDAIEKFTSMSDRGLKVNSNAQMSHWAEIILSRQGEPEDDSEDELINSQMYVA